MLVPRDRHTATLLSNGKVLVAGGISTGNQLLSSAEIYDPATGTWKPTGSTTTFRYWHSASLLANGWVLVSGGEGASPFASTELYDPVTGVWTATGSMNTARYFHTSTLLPNGKVLVAGGDGNSGYLASAELYDPATGTWTATSTMSVPRYNFPATVLPNGKVLAVGGINNNGIISNAETYDPALGQWTGSNALNIGRFSATATVLPNGKVLIAGGAGNGGYPANAELYDAGLNFSNVWRPQITTITSPLALGSDLLVTGTQFRGVSEGSTGNSQDSSADYPVVQLRSIESGRSLYLLTTNWTTNTFVSLPIWGFPPGYTLATVFVNGVASTSSVLNISVPIPVAEVLTGARKTNGGPFLFSFTNNVGVLCGVMATTNLALPLANWSILGAASEMSPGRFQFADLQATNSPRRFYRVYSP
jgi:hypothetical protein